MFIMFENKSLAVDVLLIFHINSYIDAEWEGDIARYFRGNFLFFFSQSILWAT